MIFNNRKRIARLLGLSLLSMFVLSICWQLLLEGIAMHALDLPYDQQYERTQAWRFIFTSTVVAALSLILPSLILLRQLREIADGHRGVLVAQKRSDELAQRDMLTGLPNRRAFMNSLDSLVPPSQEQTAFFFIDLDNFKRVNDLYGHEIGDIALSEIASRLDSVATQRGATLARLGGDEFVMASTGFRSRDELSSIGQELVSIVAKPLRCINNRIILGATVGIAVAPQDANDAQTLLRLADRAMYSGKHTGRSTFRFHDSSAYNHPDEIQAKFERDLEAAVAKNEIIPFYQPIVSLPEQILVGFEILARWNRPEHGLCLPDAFIPTVERLGLMCDMMLSLLHQVCSDARHWPAHLTLALNLTASQIGDEAFVERLCTQIDDDAFPSSRIQFEITEDAPIRNIGAAERNLEKLHGRGIKVALDDFGIGYSGLYNLMKLPVDKIKIDKSFFDAPQQTRELPVRAIFGLAKIMHIDVVAEGIECSEVVAWLNREGCQFAQGYLFGCAVPAAAVLEMVSDPGTLQLGTVKSDTARADDGSMVCGSVQSAGIRSDQACS